MHGGVLERSRVHQIHKNAFVFAIFRPSHGIFWCESLMAGPGGARGEAGEQGVNVWQVLTTCLSVEGGGNGALCINAAGAAWRLRSGGS